MIRGGGRHGDQEGRRRSGDPRVEVVLGEPVAAVAVGARPIRARSTVFRRAWAAVEPELTGTRSRMPRGTRAEVMLRLAPTTAPVVSRRARRGEARDGHAASGPRSRCGSDPIPAGWAPRCRRIRRGPPGVTWGTRMNPSAACSRHGLFDLGRHLQRGAHEGGPVRHLDHQLSDGEVFASARARHLAAVFIRSSKALSPALDDARLGQIGVDVRERAVGVVAGEVAVPHLFEEEDGGRTAHLLPADHGRSAPRRPPRSRRGRRWRREGS